MKRLGLPTGLAGSRLALPRRSIRLRLTSVYAVLFLLSGAGLLTITYVLVDNHSRGPVIAATTGGAKTGEVSGVPGQQVCVGPGAGLPPPPSQLGQCVAYLQARAATQRADYLNTLLIGSAIALGVMTIVALGLGLLVSGRVLSPLRTITWATRNISASNLHERLSLDGPDDELKELGDTVDGLLARLEGSFAAQRQFVANASHELRTPLARQRTVVEVALADPGRSRETLETACQRVLAAGQQQERLIEALLTLARSQRGLDEYERVDLAALASQTAASRSREASQRDIKVTVADSPAACLGNTRLAERLITNLVDNAIRHNHAGGRVIVRTMTGSGQAVLSVANTGPVIQPAEVPWLFEPFRRRGGRRTGDSESPGLGLSIVGAIAAAHNASVWVSAQPEGGLDIQVRFPSQLAQAVP